MTIREFGNLRASELLEAAGGYVGASGIGIADSAAERLLSGTSRTCPFVRLKSYANGRCRPKAVIAFAPKLTFSR